ncbi:MAG: chromosomal replication initiator DnaA [Rhizobiales bacterium]|nr:chromosomal replication initiator DnaA [Hyphomicrobiales bacterium]
MAPSDAFAVPVAELTATSRREPYVAFARQSAMYLAHVTFSLSYSEIGEAFGRDRTTAAHACRLVEDRRDDPAIDNLMASLETACAAMRAGLGATQAAEAAESQTSRRPS